MTTDTTSGAGKPTSSLLPSNAQSHARPQLYAAPGRATPDAFRLAALAFANSEGPNGEDAERFCEDRNHKQGAALATMPRIVLWQECPDCVEAFLRERFIAKGSA